MSIAAGVGFIALAGVAVEIGVLMITYLNQALDRRSDEMKRETSSITEAELREAISEGSVFRVRPIIMTVAVTIGGLLPLMFGSGDLGT